MKFLKRLFFIFHFFYFTPVPATHSVRVKSLMAPSGCDELAFVLEQEILTMIRANYTLDKLTVTQNGGAACRAMIVFLSQSKDLLVLEYAPKSNMLLPYIN